MMLAAGLILWGLAVALVVAATHNVTARDAPRREASGTCDGARVPAFGWPYYCVRAAGHPGEHRDASGSTWTS